MVSYHKMIYNIVGSGIYHTPYSIFKSKYQEFHNKNIGIFSRNYARMAGYLMGMQEGFRCKKIFNRKNRLQNSSVSLPKTNSTKQLCVFMIISRGKCAVYF